MRKSCDRTRLTNYRVTSTQMFSYMNQIFAWQRQRPPPRPRFPLWRNPPLPPFLRVFVSGCQGPQRRRPSFPARDSLVTFKRDGERKAEATTETRSAHIERARSRKGPAVFSRWLRPFLTTAFFPAITRSYFTCAAITRRMGPSMMSSFPNLPRDYPDHVWERHVLFILVARTNERTNIYL